MGTVLASAIIGKAHSILIDSNVRWPDTELLGWLNDGQREVVNLVPSANPKTVSQQLVAGILQTIPTGDGIRLLDVTRNLGTNGTTAGPAILPIDSKDLAQYNLSWAADTPSATVQHYMWDPRSPKQFYVYPAQPASPGYVEMVYSALPVDVAATANAINIDDVWQNALLDYILWRAFMKDAEYATVERSKVHQGAFLVSIGKKGSNDIEIGPDSYQPPRSKEKA